MLRLLADCVAFKMQRKKKPYFQTAKVWPLCGLRLKRCEEIQLLELVAKEFELWVQGFNDQY